MWSTRWRANWTCEPSGHPSALHRTPSFGKAFSFSVPRTAAKSPVQPTCADGQDTYRTAKLSCCLWQKQAKRSWGRRPNLRARCDARWKFGQRQPLALRVCEAIRPSARFSAKFCPQGDIRGKEFLTCAAGRNGFPLKRVVFRHALASPDGTGFVPMYRPVYTASICGVSADRSQYWPV